MKFSNIALSLVATLVSFAAAATTKADIQDERALFAYLKVQPGTEQQFLDATADVIEQSRKESGCLIYILHESEQDPTQFLIYELFKSDADLQAHRKAQYVVDFLSTVNPILVPGGFVLNEFDVK